MALETVNVHCCIVMTATAEMFVNHHSLMFYLQEHDN